MRSTGWRPRDAAWQFGSHGKAAIRKLNLGHMSTSTIVRCFASLALLGSLVAAGYSYMVGGIRQTYFPDEPNGYLFAIITALCLLAAYFIASIRCGRFLWIMRAPRAHHQTDEKEVG